MSPEVRLVRARVGLVAGLLLIGLLTPVAVATSTNGTVDAYRATHGLGSEGTFVPERQSCHQRRPWSPWNCSWYGTFTADDGSVVLDEALLDHALGTRRGDAPPAPVTPALFGGSTDPAVVHLPGDRWWLPLAVALGLVGAAAVATLRLLRWYRRASRPAESRHQA